MNWQRLINGELTLTLDLMLGFVIGAIIIRTGLADKVLHRALPWLKRWGIGASLGAGLAVSVGSSRAGAAIISSALDSGRISERTAKWGTLLIAFPAYIRRWITTMIISCSLAGWAGALFALTILFRTTAKFAFNLIALNRGEHEDSPMTEVETGGRKESLTRFMFKLMKTLPLAWLFYALAFLLMPLAEKYLEIWLRGSTFIPLPALAIAGASFAHVTSALALAGGSLAAGELSVAQAFFALLLGNTLTLLTRLVRTNAGYYFGLFPRALAQSMLMCNIAVTAVLAVFTLVLAAIPLCF